MNNPIRILLVDDSPYFLKAAGDFLRFQESVEVVDTATNAEEAIEKSRQLELDVILLDLNLGDRSGLELIPLFREHRPQTKIIVLTIMDEAAYRAAALQAGADAFVGKTVMIKSLVSTILELAGPTSNRANGNGSHKGKKERPIRKSRAQVSPSTSKSSRRKTKIGMKKERKA